MERDSFIFYRSYFEAIQEFDGKKQLKLFNSIAKYALYGEIPVGLNGIEKAVFSLIEPQLNANNKRYENGCKGGRPRIINQNQKETETKPNQNQKETETKPNVNVNVNDNDNVDVNDEHLTPTELKKIYTTLKLPEYDDVLTKQQEMTLKDVCKKYTKHQIEMFLKNCTYNGKGNFKANLPYILKNIDQMMGEFLQQVAREERARKIREEEEAEKRRKEAESSSKAITRGEYMKIMDKKCKELGITYDEYLNYENPTLATKERVVRNDRKRC